MCFLVSKKKKLIALNLNILDFDKQTKHTIDKRFTQSKAGHKETVGVQKAVNWCVIVFCFSEVLFFRGF